MDKWEQVARRQAENCEELLVVMQAAWIEYKRGKGAEAAMVWIHNTLAGPGLIPREDEPCGDDAQGWFDLNRPNAFPPCVECGAPTHRMVGGEGYCDDHVPDP